MSATTDTICPDCGAAEREGKTCREQFEQALALEFEDPEVFGAVHHLTVICYNLQHPGGFTEPALDWMRSSLRGVLREGLTPTEMRSRAQARFEGQARVRCGPASSQARERPAWSMTIANVRTDNPEVYVESIRAWAKAILGDLAHEIGTNRT